ncbi:MAG: ABC transporter ATP-binding protein [Chloroflexota bacterium]|nr:ABC transporter ATP-binding protein [Chloroflexia bacterium]MDQ3226261.1 ABC transporter ATP-binding protein [Chloroflexota bacterium]
MGANLQVRALSKAFDNTVAVDDVSLDVSPGEFLSLLGPSGCGKTTTLRLIAGLERADDGEIVIDGREVTNVPPQRRMLGMVFQQYALFPNLTAYENIAFALRVRRQSKSEVARRVGELLAVVHLEDAAGRYPHQLSGGMQQRVALARALAAEPPLLLLDEPLSALDAAIRDELRTELRRLQRQLELTVIYVTHDQAEAMAISDRIVVMDRGTVNQIGSPQELYDRPATRFSASFIGASNRRLTTVELVDGEPTISWGTARLPVTPNGAVNPGSTVLAVWRPEAAAVSALLPESAVTAAMPSALRGRIELVTFLGPITRLDVRVDGDDEPVLVDLVSAAAAHLEAGQVITVTVPPDAIRIYT